MKHLHMALATTRTPGWVLGAALLLMAAAFPARADTSECGDPFVNHFGPFDYRTASQADKTIVENVHFTTETEQLKPNSGTGYIGGDLGYTLRVFPNHPRALLAMSRLSIKEKTPVPRAAKISITCYFDRAIRFAPDDLEVYLIYGVHLMKTGDAKGSVVQLEKAASLNPNNANAQYNLGIAYAELKDYDNALPHAQRAYELGFPLPGLRNMLEKAGKWKAPQAGTAPSAQVQGSAAPGGTETKQ